MQNDRMAAVGRDLWVPLGQPLLKQGHPEQGAQAYVQAALGDPQGEGLYPLWATCASDTLTMSLLK